MGQQFDRVAIAQSIAGPEYVVLETQTIIDFGQGQGPQGGVVTVKDGWISVQGAGEARLDGGVQDPGGVFPARLELTGKGKLAVKIAAHDDPTPDPASATVYLVGATAQLRMRDASGNEHTLLDGAGANLWLGGKEADGDVVLFKKGTATRNATKATIHLDGDAAAVTFRDGSGNSHAFLDGAQANLWLGGKAADGDVVLFKKGQTANRDTTKSTIHLDGEAGAVTLRDGSGNSHAFLDGAQANLWLGGKEADGDIVLFKKGETDNRNTDKASIHLNGDAGDIILRNADCAEDFDLGEGGMAEPGTVMVIDEHGRLEPGRTAYDRKVAGVVSGAGSCRPGIVLDRQRDRGGRQPVALVGKVYCKADASKGAIAVGDLLTTSDTPGHAMKAQDPLRAFGAVIGKALGSLQTGTGLIPILVALQ